MRKITEEWLKAAEDDLLVIERILDEDYLTHMVALHAQQAIEKSIKGVMEERRIPAAKIHNLRTLFSKIRGHVSATVDENMLKTLDALYLESRYPSDLGLLPDGKPSAEDARKFFSEAKRFHEAIKKELGGT